MTSNIHGCPLPLSSWIPWLNMLWMLAILNRILAFSLPAQTSLRTWACSWQIKPWSIVDLSLFNLSILNQSVCFWSLDLEIILPLHLSFELVSCFYNLISLHSFFFWMSIDAHIRSLVDHHILCWIIIRQCPSYLITLWVLPGYIMPLLNCILSFGQPCSTLNLC